MCRETKVFLIQNARKSLAYFSAANEQPFRGRQTGTGRRGEKERERERWTPTMGKLGWVVWAWTWAFEGGFDLLLLSKAMDMPLSCCCCCCCFSIRVWSNRRVWALAHQKCTIDGTEKKGRRNGRGWDSDAAERTEIPLTVFSVEKLREKERKKEQLRHNCPREKLIEPWTPALYLRKSGEWKKGGGVGRLSSYKCKKDNTLEKK